MTERDEGKEKKEGTIGWREGTVIAEGVAQIGCLTLVIVLGALGAGLLLDKWLGTRPWFTLGLVLASIPVSIAALIWVGLSTARRTSLFEAEDKTEKGKEEE